MAVVDPGVSAAEPLVRQLRRERGLSQGDLGVLVGLTAAQLSLIELGKRAPAEPEMDALARIFDRLREDLFPIAPWKPTRRRSTSRRVAQRRASVASLHRQGLRDGEIARRLRVKKSLVREDRLALGLSALPLPDQRVGPPDRAEAAERLYVQDELSLEQAATRLGVSQGTVLRDLRSRGVARRQPGGRSWRIELQRDGDAWVPVAAAMRRTGLPRAVLEQEIAKARLSTVRGGRGSLLVPLKQLELVAELLEAERIACLCGCGELALAGRAWVAGHQSQLARQVRWSRPGARERAAETMRETRRRHAGTMGRPLVARVQLPCAICGDTLEFTQAVLAGRRARNKYHRPMCSDCVVAWRSARLATTNWIKIDRTNVLTAEAFAEFERALARGRAFEVEVAARWTKRGRRPPLALNLVIEAMLARGLTDDQIQYLIEKARQERGLQVPGTRGGKLHRRYVTRRRQEAGIHRPVPSLAA